MCFTAIDAVAKFKEVTGFEFYPTVVGQILKMGGFVSPGFTSDNKRVYNDDAWKYAWIGMHFKASKRASYQDDLSYEFIEVPPMPDIPRYQGKVNKLKRKGNIFFQ